jgi:hypothetical protein
VLLLRLALECHLPAYALAVSPAAGTVSAVAAATVDAPGGSAIDALIASALCSTLPRRSDAESVPSNPRGNGGKPADDGRGAPIFCPHAAAGCHHILGAVFWLFVGAVNLCRTIGRQTANAAVAAPEWCCANRQRGPPASAARGIDGRIIAGAIVIPCNQRN